MKLRLLDDGHVPFIVVDDDAPDSIAAVAHFWDRAWATMFVRLANAVMVGKKRKKRRAKSPQAPTWGGQ